MPEVEVLSSSSPKRFIPADAFLNISLTVMLKNGEEVSIPCNGIPLRKGPEGSLMDTIITTLAEKPELSEQILGRFKLVTRSIQLADSGTKKYKTEDLF